jgi:hypothetical protein
MQQGITGFVKVKGSQDENKIYAIGSGGRPIADEADLMRATGASSIAEAWKMANVKEITLEQAKQYGVTAKEAQAKGTAPTTSTPPVIDEQAAKSQVINIYANNFGRQPSQVELDTQMNALKSGQLDIEHLNWWAVNSPENIAKTGKSSPSQTGDPIDVAQLKNYGISETDINAMSQNDRNMLSSLTEVINKQYENSKTVPLTFTAQDLDRIYAEAQADPTIDRYYKEQLTIGKDQFKQSLEALRTGQQLTEEQQKREFPQQQKQAAEAAAAAGQAYSGFREQAKQKLGAEQQAVVTSTASQLKQNLQNLGRGFETTYGTGALSEVGGASIGNVQYTPLNVAGTLESDRAAAIRQKELDIQAKEALSRGMTQSGTTTTTNLSA